MKKPRFVVCLGVPAVGLSGAWLCAAPQSSPAAVDAPKAMTERQHTRREERLRVAPYRKWLNEEVTYIVTDEQRSTFRRLNTDTGREKFIEQFWLRRDPTPGTLENEFREEHYRRFAHANQHLASQNPGWKTDRGRIYIVFGPPDEIDDHSSDSKAAFPFVDWTYRHLDGSARQNRISGHHQIGRGPHVRRSEEFWDSWAALSGSNSWSSKGFREPV
jgi:GWxTD domain-containing protein